MLDFLRICAGSCRRFFLFAAAGKLGVDFPANRAMECASAWLEFAAETRRGMKSDLQVEERVVSPDDARGTAIARTQLLDHYEAIAVASQRMLDAARDSDWDEVARQEDRCRTLIASLKAAAFEAPLRPADNRRRLDLLRKILADDAEIRGRTDPWLKQLERLISSPHTRD